MRDLPDHVVTNREAWRKMSESFAEPGRRSWSTDVFTWGIWNVPEAEVRALGDLADWNGKDVVELGTGTGYISAWLARRGARPVGVDITPEQLSNNRAFQQEYGIEFPLLLESAEETSLPSSSFDLAISEYGASIWCDPTKWIPEAARLLRPGGLLVFLRNGTISILCSPPVGLAKAELVNDYRSISKRAWDDGVEFHVPTGDMIRLLRSSGLEIENMIELFPPADAEECRYEYIDLAWSKRWPSEEIWVARKK